MAACVRVVSCDVVGGTNLQMEADCNGYVSICAHNESLPSIAGGSSLIYLR